MNDSNSEKDELNDAELIAVTGGTIVDTVVETATKIWNLVTSPPKGIKGESKDDVHKDWII